MTHTTESMANAEKIAAGLLALAGRCEAATGPHRELDALIWCALNGKRYKDHFPVEFGGGQALGHTRVEFTEPPRRTRLVSGQHRGGDALPYTASLDAATTLVPERCGWIAGWGQTRPDEPMGGALITPHASFAGYDVANDALAEGEAATPALALCAAALRAREILRRQS